MWMSLHVLVEKQCIKHNFISFFLPFCKFDLRAMLTMMHMNVPAHEVFKCNCHINVIVTKSKSTVKPVLSSHTREAKKVTA